MYLGVQLDKTILEHYISVLNPLPTLDKDYCSSYLRWTGVHLTLKVIRKWHTYWNSLFRRTASSQWASLIGQCLWFTVFTPWLDIEGQVAFRKIFNLRVFKYLATMGTPSIILAKESWYGSIWHRPTLSYLEGTARGGTYAIINILGRSQVWQNPN